jgi:hypothetical protein
LLSARKIASTASAVLLSEASVELGGVAAGVLLAAVLAGVPGVAGAAVDTAACEVPLD